MLVENQKLIESVLKNRNINWLRIEFFLGRALVMTQDRDEEYQAFDLLGKSLGSGEREECLEFIYYDVEYCEGFTEIINDILKF